MTKTTLLFRKFGLLLLLTLAGISVKAQDFSNTTSYKLCGGNKVKNPAFGLNPDNSPTVTDWTFTPAGDSDLGWKEDQVLIYGNYLFLDRLGTHTATPALNPALCPSTPKVIKFFYNAGNTGAYNFNVKLGTQTVANFKEVLLAAKSLMTLGAGVKAHVVDRRFISEGPISGNQLWNNIWHEVTLYVPAYTTGNLSFEYIRAGGISRQIRLDNVEIYEAIPQPILNATSVATANCDTKIANLNTLYTPVPGAAYEWHTTPVNPSAATKVADPAQAKIGTYFLYVTSTSACTAGAGCYGPASVPATVKGPADCCGGNLITNGNFTTYTTSPTETNGGAVISGGPKVLTAVPWVFDPALYGAIKVTDAYANPQGARINAIALDPAWYQTPAFSQRVKLCPGSSASLSMNYGMSQNASVLQYRYVSVQLADAVVPDVKTLLQFEAYSNTPTNINIKIVNPSPEVTNLKVNGVLYVTGTVLAQQQLHLVTFDFKVPDTFHDNTNLVFSTGQGAIPIFTNVSVIDKGAAPKYPTSFSGSTTCPGGTFDLTTVQPVAAGYKFLWRVGAAIGSDFVADPKKVKKGDYYMETVSECSGCPVSGYTKFTVNEVCPTVEGKVFADYDGAAGGGIANGPGQSGGGLYALLVNSADNRVIGSAKVGNDGAYSISGTNGTAYVMLHNKDVAAGVAAPATATLNPNYVATGETVGGTLDGSPDSKTIAFQIPLGSGKTVVNFGIQYPPVSSDASDLMCHPGAGYAHTMATLYGVDDDPAWNDGIGKKIRIKTVSATNGTLSYNGTPVTGAYEIAAYNPALLKFTIGTADAASIAFTYVFVDAAGAESQVPGAVSCKFHTASVTGANVVYMGETITLTGLPAITAGTSWVPADPSVLSVSAAGVVTPLRPGATAITYTDMIGCTATTQVTVKPVFTLAAPAAVCPNSTVSLQLNGSEKGVSYRLFNVTENRNEGAAVAGTGSPVFFNTGKLAAATTYKVIATETATGIQTTLSTQAVVAVHPVPTVAVTKTAPETFCAPLLSGKITVTATGGTAPYIVKLYKNNELAGESPATSGTHTFTGLSDGKYFISITDGNGCVHYQYTVN